MCDDSHTNSPDNQIPYGYCHCGCGQKTSIAKANWTLRGHVKGQPKRFVFGHGHAKKPPTTLVPGQSKTCTTCNQEKDVIHFTPNKSYRDGYVNTCRECYREYHRRHYDPDRSREASQLRAKRLRENGGSHTPDEWRQLLEQHDGRCAKCGTKESVGKDHIIPISKGGNDDISNIQPLCKTCNLTKGVKVEDYRNLS